MKQLRTAITLLIIFTAMLGFAYPLAVTGIAQTAFNKQANGSLIEINRVVVGSELIGQLFASERYFHSRPSSVNYDAANSGGSNQGPLNESLKNAVKERIATVRAKNGLASDAVIPSDMITASASGLDPHISIESAILQVSRVAKARGFNENVLKAIVEQQTEQFPFGTGMVNVLKLNLAIDNTNHKALF